MLTRTLGFAIALIALQAFGLQAGGGGKVPDAPINVKEQIPTPPTKLLKEPIPTLPAKIIREQIPTRPAKLTLTDRILTPPTKVE